MNYKNKTKKRQYKKMKKRKYNSTIKYVGGGNSLYNKETPNQVLDEVKREHEFNLSTAPILQKTSELAEGVALKTIENIGLLLGIDLSNPEDVNGNLDKIKLALSNPETKEKIRSIIGQVSEILGVAIEAASPFIEPLMNKTFEVGTEALSKMSEAGVKIVLNTAEEIPGVGVLIGTIRSGKLKQPSIPSPISSLISIISGLNMAKGPIFKSVSRGNMTNTLASNPT
jgi:hypothetical protein